MPLNPRFAQALLTLADRLDNEGLYADANDLTDVAEELLTTKTFKEAAAKEANVVPRRVPKSKI